MLYLFCVGREKRKKSDDEEDLDDRLEDEDYDLLEENLGVKVERRVSNFKDKCMKEVTNKIDHFLFIVTT